MFDICTNSLFCSVGLMKNAFCITLRKLVLTLIYPTNPFWGGKAGEKDGRKQTPKCWYGVLKTSCLAIILKL